MKLKIIREKNDNNTVFLSMVGEMTIYTVKKLKDILLKEINEFPGIVVNLSGVDEADTAGFQLLMFLKREAISAGKQLVFNEPSVKIKSLFTLYNENI